MRRKKEEKGKPVNYNRDKISLMEAISKDVFFDTSYRSTNKTINLFPSANEPLIYF